MLYFSRDDRICLFDVDNFGLIQTDVDFDATVKNVSRPRHFEPSSTNQNVPV